MSRDTLQRLGFDWARELLRELSEQEDLERRGVDLVGPDAKRWLRRFAERALRKQQAR